MTEDEGVLPRWASSVNWIRLAVVEAGLTAEELPSMPALHATLATEEMLEAPISSSLAAVLSAELLVLRCTRLAAGASWAVSEWFSISIGTDSSPLPLGPEQDSCPHLAPSISGSDSSGGDRRHPWLAAASLRAWGVAIRRCAMLHLYC